MSRVVVNEIEAKVGNDITFNDTVKIDTAQIDTVRGKTTAGSVTVQGEGTATTNLQQGLSKHWVNINGTGTIATRDSFNLSSVVDNGTANYTFNLTNAHNNINYTLTCSGGEPGSNKPHVAIPFIVSDTDYPPTTSAYRIGMLEPGTAWADAKYVIGVTHGDLA